MALQKIECLVFSEEPSEVMASFGRALRYGPQVGGAGQCEVGPTWPPMNEASKLLNLLSVYRLVEIGLCQRGVFPEGAMEVIRPDGRGRQVTLR